MNKKEIAKLGLKELIQEIKNWTNTVEVNTFEYFNSKDILKMYTDEYNKRIEK